MSKANHGRGDPALGRAFLLIVGLPVPLWLGAEAVHHPTRFLDAHSGDPFDILFFTAVVAAVALLPVPVSRVLQLTLTFPLLLGVAILYHPAVAGVVALVGSFDARELKRGITPTKALFNRSQIALATWAGSAVFHAIAASPYSFGEMVVGVLLAAGANYLVNSGLVTIALRLLYQLPLRSIATELRLGALSEFLLNYVGLAFVGVIIATLYENVGIWSVAAFVLPLVFARQMFFRNMDLEQATKELKDRERVLRALSNRMAEERQDERMQIAAYLHDDLAQMLFRLNLQIEMAKKGLAKRDLAAVSEDLEGLSQTKQQTSDAVRALIRDLHRSPIGREGLAEAIRSFSEDIAQGQPTTITTDVVEVSLPPPIQLLIYQIAREAAMNALKHAVAENIAISLRTKDEGVELEITDDGRGFDTSASLPDGHFGTVMMRERALVAGGTYSIESEAGKGTTVWATFPSVWLEEGIGEAGDDGASRTAASRGARDGSTDEVTETSPTNEGERESASTTSGSERPVAAASNPGVVPPDRGGEAAGEPREHRRVPA
jgi:signal transduction histidine kinase